MKKIFRLFTALLTAALLFNSCSMFEKNAYDENANVTFEIPAQVLRNIARNGGDGLEGKNIYIDVKLTGSYTDSTTVKTSFTPDYNNERNPDAELDNQIAAQTITFNSVPVGSTVKAEVYITSAMAFEDQVSEYKEALYKGASETITVQKGENPLTVKLEYVYKSFPVNFTLDFTNSYKPYSFEDFSMIYVMGFKQDSALLNEFYKRFANGKGTMEDFDYFLGKMYDLECGGYGLWSQYSSEEYPYEVLDNSIKLSGKLNLMKDENLVFVSLAAFNASTDYYQLAPRGVCYAGYPNLNSLSALKASAVNPSEGAVNLVLNTSNLIQDTMYALCKHPYNAGYTMYPTTDISNVGVSVSTDGGYAFDKYGYLYILDDGVIRSYRGAHTLHLKEASGAEVLPIQITTDRETNTLYAFYAEGTNKYYVYKLTDYFTKGVVEEPKDPDYSLTNENFADVKSNADFNNDIILINNGILYGFGCGARAASVGRFYKIDLNDPDLIAQNLNLNNTELQLPDMANILDMIYQDGNIYMLWNQQGSSDNNAIVSQGGILKYSVTTGAYTLKGFDSKKSFTDELFAACSYGGDPVYDKETDTLYIATFSLAGATYGFNIEAPYNNEKTHFAGPEKFIAIKPKKLVISDSGLAIYTNQEGLLAQKKVNRIIEVDLATLSMEDAKVTDVDLEIDGSYASISFSDIRVNVQCYSGQFVTKNDGVLSDVSDGNKDFYPYIIEE